MYRMRMRPLTAPSTAKGISVKLFRGETVTFGFKRIPMEREPTKEYAAFIALWGPGNASEFPHYV